MRGTVYVTVDIGRSSLEVAVDYCATPEEPMVRYYSDGSGYPGCPAEAELLDVSVTRWDTSTEERYRGDHWIWGELDEMARVAIEREWDSRFESLCLADAACGAED
jgi:hypothetical protein